ncbi:hypothetical protein K493DRAFT_342978 [Basidiobolus meristosporus CBS 931.73]|uniref:Uncharacterized protein n=1 Tax=Basidiobolus meristosporus CBS 931.73 TaxID=1314790 RepID=A0A1Y1WUQ3_9FUNG|nr:hypothetical protein K493DRAFT_342978 [Basidiobolus meristosporus CBS 931.73]|eukprot:ORX77018.1 hypothetical protein K493DRAFT_342978 [Basidiobolus meristosporus CBS 931.73]
MRFSTVFCSLTMALLAGTTTSAQSSSALLKLVNTPEDTAQQLPFSAGSCQRVTYSSITPESPSTSAQAVLYPSLQDCYNRRNRIAAITSKQLEVPIAKNGKEVTVGAVRVSVS